jgi:hypothetical protein
MRSIPLVDDPTKDPLRLAVSGLLAVLMLIALLILLVAAFSIEGALAFMIAGVTTALCRLCVDMWVGRRRLLIRVQRLEEQNAYLRSAPTISRAIIEPDTSARSGSSDDGNDTA